MKIKNLKQTDGKLKRLISDAKYRFGLLEKRQKIIVFSLAGFVVLCILAVMIIPLFSSVSSVKFYVRETDAPAGLEKSGVPENAVFESNDDTVFFLDRFARKGEINKNEPAGFKFTRGQQEKIRAFYERNGSAAVCVRLELKPTAAQLSAFENSENSSAPGQNRSSDYDFSYGLLDSSDFTVSGKYKGKSVGRILVKAHVSQIVPAIKKVLDSGVKNPSFTFDVSIALNRTTAFNSDNIPTGFILNTPVRTKITGVYIQGAKVGFDYSSDINFYGYPSTGGMLDFYTQNADFSGCQQIFPTRYSKNEVMPRIEVKYFPESSADVTEDGEFERIKLSAGGDSFYIKRISGRTGIELPAACMQKPFSRFDITQGKNQVSCLLMKDGYHAETIPADGSDKDVLIAVKTDPGLILNWNKDCWRNPDFELYEWDRFPGVLFFDIRTLVLQEKFFTRLAFFVEKQGYKGKLLTNEELKGKHGYNAHDYNAESMARFFNKAYDINFTLNDEEILLKKILLANGFLTVDSEYKGHVKGENKGLVSISRQTADWSRYRLLAHEGWHTLFFMSEEFRNFVAATYYTIDPLSRDFLIGYFRANENLGYDVNDAYLMNNEFMAYIMQQPLNKVADYFIRISGFGEVRKLIPELSDYVGKTKARSFEDAAVMLDEFVHDAWGIECGNISLVEKK